MERIYLDYAATTPLEPAAIEAMLPFLRTSFHNPSSLYEGAREARRAVDAARDRIAGVLSCHPAELIFTSSGTESANLAVIGSLIAARDSGRKKVLLGATEHHAVLNLTDWISRLGFEPRICDPRRIVEEIDEQAFLASVMHANNETGEIYDFARIGSMCRHHGVLYHCDAVQSFGILPIDLTTTPIDLLTLSGHKCYGPKGVGVLYVRAGVRLAPLITGGGQERELRSGTENVAAIVGLGAAIESIYRDASRASRIQAARDEFEKRLFGGCGEEGLPRPIPTLGEGVARLPQHCHVRFPGADAQSMLINLDSLGVDAGSGAACSSGSVEPSHVLTAMGFSASEAKECLRFTFGKDTSPEAAAEAAKRVVRAYSAVLCPRK